jgi:drug/metabolite transporter (DMT)-like permease
MQTETMQMNKRRGVVGGRWWLPIWCLGLGSVVLIAELIGGNARNGAITAGIFLIVAAAFYAAERSEAFRGLGGADGDERFRGIETTAMSLAGRAMALCVIAAMVIEIARGNDAAQYSWIVGVGTVAYVGSILWLQRHR